jgi:hypothetical protein
MYGYALLYHHPARGFERYSDGYRSDRFWFEQRGGNCYPYRWNFTVHLCVGALRRNRSNGYWFGCWYLHGNHHRRKRMYHHRFRNGNPAGGISRVRFFANKRFLQRRQQWSCND